MRRRMRRRRRGTSRRSGWGGAAYGPRGDGGGGGGQGRRKNLDHCFVKHTNLLFPPFPSNEFSAGAGLLAPSPLQSKVYSRSLRANVCPGTA